jgi:hypothetical protein
MSVDCFYMIVSSFRCFQNIFCHNKHIINPKRAMHAIIEALYFTCIVTMSMITHPYFMHEIVILHTPFCEANYGIYK